MSILLVEDEPDLREEIAAGLKDFGFEVIEANDGAQGIAAIHEHRPDLVLCDVSMPGMNGWDFLNKLRGEFPQFANIPFVFLSGLTSDQNILEGLKRGADDYLTKPIDIEKLVAKIRSSLRIRNEYEARLAHHASFDTLTGLPSRAHALDRLDRELVRASTEPIRVHALSIGFDDFGRLNGALGRDAGDNLLSCIAKRVDAAVSQSGEFDATVSRLGGEEFLITLSSDGPVDCSEIVVHRLFNAFSKAFEIGEHEARIKIRIGIASHKNSPDDAREMVNMASLAREMTKGADGHAYRYFTPKMSETATQGIETEHFIRRALGNGELQVHYQPVIEADGERLIGAEALVRWNNPSLGQVPPDKFIPVAERTGDIIAIGEWVLATACRQAQQWRAAYGIPFRIAVNFSPRQFESTTIVEKIAAILKECELPPESLEIEVTERLLIEDTPVMSAIINELNAMGTQLSIDDFGTGFSSLGLLKQYPFHTVKIDRSFVGNVTTEPMDANLVRSIISMAHGLGLELIAEGIETAEQLAFLRQHKCDYVQGYYLGKPMPAAEFNQYIETSLTAVHSTSNTRAIP
ncbi:MAG: EAL domain-containing protein [Rhodospirillales bacterium]|nr:EAL domain-containing protein [Rhodospirillales bacterium]